MHNNTAIKVENVWKIFGNPSPDILKIAQALASTEIFLVLSIFSDSSDNADSGIATDNFNVI